MRTPLRLAGSRCAVRPVARVRLVSRCLPVIQVAAAGNLPVLRRRYVTMPGMGAHRFSRSAASFLELPNAFIKKGPGCLTGPPMNLFQYRPRCETRRSSPVPHRFPKECASGPDLPVARRKVSAWHVRAGDLSQRHRRLSRSSGLPISGAILATLSSCIN